MADISKLGFDWPDVIVHGLEIIAPAASSVLVDSGPVPSIGHWRWRVWIFTSDSASTSAQIAHRNAANNGDVELVDVPLGNFTTQQLDVLYNMAASERVVIRNVVVGTAGKGYQANIYGWLLP